MKITPEMNPLAMSLQQANLTAATQQASGDFQQLLTSAINHVNGLQQQSSELSTRFDLGDRSVSLSDVMIARNKSSVAFEATLQVRNKLVEAYKELMNMPV